MHKLLAAIAMLAVAFVTLVSAPVRATEMTFSIDWDGAHFGNGAHAHALMTIDAAALTDSSAEDNGGYRHLIPFISAFSMTVAGSAGGNGTYVLSDFNDIITHIPGALDLSQQLIGQALNNGCVFGDNDCADFNVFDYNRGPQGYYPFGIYTDIRAATPMYMTSFIEQADAAAVPEPAVLALFSLGVMGVGMSRRFNVAKAART